MGCHSDPKRSEGKGAKFPDGLIVDLVLLRNDLYIEKNISSTAGYRPINLYQKT
jgi:hypothetical protein